MIESKQNPVGIDRRIADIQEVIDKPLEDLWESITLYGRVYKKQTDKGISLERYKSNGEYENVLHSEGNKIFFVVANEAEYVSKNRMNTDLWLIAILDLRKSKKKVRHRADEEVHQDLFMALNRAVHSNEIEEMLVGESNLQTIVEETFKATFRFGDIQPYHVFAIKLNLNYEYKC